MSVITSRNHPLIKQLIKLGSSAAQRHKTGLTLLDGEHLLQTYLTEIGVPQQVIVSQSYAEQPNLAKIIDNTVKTTIVSDTLFHAISPVKTPIGILALITTPQPQQPIIAQERFIVLLEDIQDPGNLGSIIRSAAAAGVQAVYLSHRCADAWSPKTLRAAMGAHFLLHIHERCELRAIAQQFSGTVIATVLQADKNLYDTSLTGAIAFAFGNEGSGLSKDLLQIMQKTVTIPMLGKTESLNAAAAVSICLFEKNRQDRKANIDMHIGIHPRSSV